MWNLFHFHCDQREVSGSFVFDCKQVVGRVFLVLDEVKRKLNTAVYQQGNSFY